MIDVNHINEHIQQILSVKIDHELEERNLSHQIRETIDRIAQEKVDATIASLLSKLIQDQHFNEKIDNRLTSELDNKLSKAVDQRVQESANQTDIATKIGNAIAEIIEQRLDRAALSENLIPWKTINWKNFQLSADSISNGTIVNFNSSGIQDIAEDVNLTVCNGQVIIEGETVSKNLTVVETATVKNLTVNSKLTVKGAVLFENQDFAKQITGLIDNRISAYNNDNPFDLGGKSLTSNQQMLISNTELGSTVVKSNLRTVGRLNQLTVAGESSLCETVFVANNRIGINTDEPAGALTVWDEEAEFTVKKHKNRTMYLGSTRSCNLVLGVDNNSSLTVTSTGIETNSIKLGNIRISSAKSQPTHSAAPGDVVFNEKTGKGEPWAWRCRGNSTWDGLYQ